MTYKLAQSQSYQYSI